MRARQLWPWLRIQQSQRTPWRWEPAPVWPTIKLTFCDKSGLADFEAEGTQSSLLFAPFSSLPLSTNKGFGQPSSRVTQSRAAVSAAYTQLRARPALKDPRNPEARGEDSPRLKHGRRHRRPRVDPSPGIQSVNRCGYQGRCSQSVP